MFRHCEQQQMKTAAIWSTTTPLTQHMWTRGEGRQEEVEEMGEGEREHERKERERQTHETIGIQRRERQT